MAGIKHLTTPQGFEIYICPTCDGNTTFIHDLKCGICDNRSVVWCPVCRVHIPLYEEDLT